MIIKVPILDSTDTIYINTDFIVYVYPKKNGGCDIYLDKSTVNNTVFSCKLDASYILELINSEKPEN